MSNFSEKDMAQILQQSRDLILVLDPADRSLIFVNEQASQWLGYSAAELLGKKPLFLFPELTDSELEAMLLNLQENDTGEDVLLVTPVRRNYGLDHDFEFRLQYVRTADTHYVVAYGRDIAERVAITDEVHGMLASAQIESQQDSITSLYQREAFLQIFADLLSQVGPNGLRLTLLLINLKNLNEINQKYGLALGDKILRSVAGLLQRSAEKTDICARYTGRKMCMLLPGKGQQDGLLLADRINTALAKAKHAGYPELIIESCISVAELPAQGRPDLLLDRVIARTRDLSDPQQHYEVHRLGLVTTEAP